MRTPDFEVNSDWGLFKIKVGSDGNIKLTAIDTGHNRLAVHGVFMYTLWFVLGIVLLVTKRYIKSKWLAMHIAHIVVGLAVLLSTLGLGVKVLAFYNWHVHPDYH
jgi:hypothetical protein